jgi:hypothetical protein
VARKDEKTIKLSADTADVQKAFQRVEAAYADVAEAANDYAAAVTASSQAVTKEEKAIAKENEATTKTILANAKKRAGALKTQSIAMGEQQKALRGMTSGNNAAAKSGGALTESDGKASKAGMAKAAAFGVAAVAIGMVAKATSAAIGVARQMVDGMIDSKNISDAQRESLINLKMTFESADRANKEFREGVTLVVAEFAKFWRLLGPVQKAVSAITEEVKIFVKQAMLMAQLFGSMIVNAEGFTAASKRLHKVNKEIAKDAEKYVQDKKAEAKVLKNLEERKKAMAEGDKKREADARSRAEAGKRRAAERAADIKAEEEALRELILAEAEADRLNAEEEIARAKAEGIKLIDETNVRLAQELEIRQALQMNRAIAAGEDIEALQRVQDLERSLFEIRGSGVSDEEKARAERIALLRTEGQALEALSAKREEDAKTAAAASKMATDAALGAGAAALEAAGVANAGVALEAGKKAAFYTGESIASFAALNPVSGALFAAAAVQQGIVAGGALIGGASGGGGGGAKSPASVAPQSRSSQPMGISQAQPRETSMTVNVNTLSYVSPEDARRIAVSESREAQAIVGGRK